MKRKFTLLFVLLLVLIVADLTQFSTNSQILSILIPNFRLPRLITILSAGIALSLSGYIIQNITENPLADSGTIGITSGASAGSVAFLLIADHFKLTGIWNFSYPLFALIGALLSFALIYIFALRKQVSSVRVLLTGIAITAFFQALITIGQLSVNAFDFQKVAVWLSGDIWQTGTTYLIIYILLLVIGLIILPFFLKKLEILSLGEEMATVLGLDVPKTKIYLYLLALLFAAVGVLLVGGLAFVGLIAPHIAREIVGFKSRKSLIATALSGMIILSFADIISQMIIAPSSLPLGFVVAFIGAPYYIYLIQKV
ncbi:iron ABC transporter permease [Lactococcus cremoris]|uniref:FecCD family ABC transporter permease n=1 Tax=Lactococcus lactis subsp. cremoris TaxID=1359 RepID=UPI0009C0376E|nr:MULTISPECIES: iron ABC transporter permease [Lactococcus]ARE25189.1 iron ABC transporter permease [Lactococcus cremoris]MCT0458135.1 iron ABC transporter permease [Lactococcus cremoris]MCT4417622.1 iron ABC transporter permease [Lactococcus cremoris]MCT4464095.1 iron ABC transporter permease [Lactococcus cremoris]PFH05206.1 ferrichrome ABC transporter permease [Lactococcus cremoris]